MVSRRDDEIHSFLTRWSQRKRAAEESAETTARDLDAATARDAEAPAQADAATEPPVRPEDLPEIETLDASSDFSVFMKDGVPPALRRRALRKLWHSDPVFNRICELDDYNLDYTDAATVVPNLKTLYQVGKGMVLPDEPADIELAEDRAGDGDRAGEPPQVTAERPAAENEALAERDTIAVPGEQGETPVAAEARDRVRESGGPPESDSAMAAATPGRPAVAPVLRSARRRRWGDADV